MTVEQVARDFFAWFNRHYPAPSSHPDHEWNRLGVALATHQEDLQVAPSVDLGDRVQEGGASMTTFICPPQELPAEKVRQIVRDAGCDWPEDDSRESRLWRFNVRMIINAAWHRGFADHAAALHASEKALRDLFGDGDVR